MSLKAKTIHTREHFSSDGDEVEMLSFYINGKSGCGTAYWCDVNEEWKGTFLGIPVSGDRFSIRDKAQREADLLVNILMG